MADQPSVETDYSRAAADQRRYESVAATLHKAVAWAEDAEKRCKALADKIDRCEAHMRVVLGYADGERDAGLEAMVVRAKHLAEGGVS